MGVHWKDRDGKWVVRFTVDGVKKVYGSFEDKDLAIKVDEVVYKHIKGRPRKKRSSSSRATYSYWSSSEIAFLKQNADKPMDYLMKKLQRSYGSIKCQYSRIKKQGVE